MENINKIELGKRINRIRKELGETLEVFGNRFDPKANRSLVSAWENGRYVPNNERLKQIADLAGNDGITVQELLYGTREELISRGVKDGLQDFFDRLDNQGYKREDYQANKEKYITSLSGLIEEFTQLSESVLPYEEIYIRVRSWTEERFNSLYNSEARTEESYLHFMRDVLENAHVEISKYQHDPATRKSVEDGTISDDFINEIIQDLMNSKKKIGNKMDELGVPYSDSL
ncbi:helix-turn-helix domain-containing protein [Aerococcus urinaeequi]|uniref:helix-turn-helix domain-containing protein n=1 Tax=Aerococcus urinaeequi TaxID=51665 RepID=UPI003AAEEDC9